MSVQWSAEFSREVKIFRSTLTPEEAELFNECIIRLCASPHPDGKHKFRSYAWMPLVCTLYRDDNFVLIYYFTEVIKPISVRKITVFQTTRTRDLEEGNAPPSTTVPLSREKW